MLFNSLDFAVFLPIVFALYWFVTNHNLKLQNALIVAMSYELCILWVVGLEVFESYYI